MCLLCCERKSSGRCYMLTPRHIITMVYITAVLRHWLLITVHYYGYYYITILRTSHCCFMPCFHYLLIRTLVCHIIAAGLSHCHATIGYAIVIAVRTAFGTRHYTFHCFTTVCYINTIGDRRHCYWSQRHRITSIPLLPLHIVCHYYITIITLLRHYEYWRTYYIVYAMTWLRASHTHRKEE